MKAFLISVTLVVALISSCNKTDEKSSEEVPFVNLIHFNHLYDDLEIDGQEMGVIHIYSEYPNYEFSIEPNEGYTCVDDVARGIVLLSKLYAENNDQEVYRKLERLVRFVLFMQNSNGYFNNFLWGDLSINETYHTSVAEPNWWSWRALWALESSLSVINDPQLMEQMTNSISSLISNIKRDFPIPTEFESAEVETLELPTWLPGTYAADQAAILILGLVPHYSRTTDTEIKSLIEALAKGLILMQKGDGDHFPYGAFLSWKNIWHAWGNSQSYALLVAGEKLNNSLYIEKALLEVDHFYPYLLQNGFVSELWIKKSGDTFTASQKEEYPQIAYGLRPMVFASKKAYSLTSEEKYNTLAHDLEQWLYGSNVANTEMYDINTGRGYDGINSSSSINQNSGAESTIEALLIRSVSQ